MGRLVVFAAVRRDADAWRGLAAFLATVFLVTVFFAGRLVAAVFLGGDFRAAAFFDAIFRAAFFFGPVFRIGIFLAAVFFDAVFDRERVTDARAGRTDGRRRGRRCTMVNRSVSPTA